MTPTTFLASGATGKRRFRYRAEVWRRFIGVELWTKCTAHGVIHT
jgi:hypothetical protein